jgi:uncharacterized membrane protein YedE/YeeE
MGKIVSAFIAGTLFGLGLALSEMVNPARVIGFLDVAGRWDPTLIFVMGGALLVTATIFPLILRRPRPFLAEQFHLPTKKEIDRPLILGAITFGIGWGLAGFCPGPALAALASGSRAVALFVIAMVVGQWVMSRLERV